MSKGRSEGFELVADYIQCDDFHLKATYSYLRFQPYDEKFIEIFYGPAPTELERSVYLQLTWHE